MTYRFSLFAQRFKYWDLFLSWLFRYPTRCYQLKKEKKELSYETLSKELIEFGKGYRKKCGTKGIICHVTSSFQDINQVIHLLSRIHEQIKDPIFCDWSVAEILAKVLAYRNLKEGMVIPIPSRKSLEKGIAVKSYRVDEVFELWNTIQAFGLRPNDPDEGGAPILLFRGTDLSLAKKEGRASILSDLDPKGPGWTLFEKGKQVLHKWLEKKGHPARVIGHSLGGVIAAYTLIHEAKWISSQKHEASYAFNFPGISQNLLNQWNALESKPAFIGFVCRGDLISKMGFLFGKVYEISCKTPLSPIQAHEMLLFCEKKGRLREVDLEKENGSKSRRFYSRLQKHVSSTVYPFFKMEFFKDFKQ